MLVSATATLSKAGATRVYRSAQGRGDRASAHRTLLRIDRASPGSPVTIVINGSGDSVFLKGQGESVFRLPPHDWVIGDFDGVATFNQSRGEVAKFSNFSTVVVFPDGDVRVHYPVWTISPEWYRGALFPPDGDPGWRPLEAVAAAIKEILREAAAREDAARRRRRRHRLSRHLGTRPDSFTGDLNIDPDIPDTA